MSKKKPADAEPDEPAFEQSLAEVEQIVAKLEGGKLPLAEALAAYEQGVARLKSCYQTLTQAERRIALVQGVDAAGNVAASPFSDGEEADDLAEKGDSRSRRRSAPAAAPRRVDDRDRLF